MSPQNPRLRTAAAGASGGTGTACLGRAQRRAPARSANPAPAPRPVLGAGVDHPHRAVVGRTAHQARYCRLRCPRRSTHPEARPREVPNARQRQCAVHDARARGRRRPAAPAPSLGLAHRARAVGSAGARKRPPDDPPSTGKLSTTEAEHSAPPSTKAAARTPPLLSETRSGSANTSQRQSIQAGFRGLSSVGAGLRAQGSSACAGLRAWTSPLSRCADHEKKIDLVDR